MLSSAGRRASCGALLVATWLLAAFAVQAAPLAVLRIETAPGGSAPLLGGETLAAGDTLRAFAAGYDSLGVYMGPIDVDWAAVPALATLDPGRGTTAFLRATTPGVFHVRAVHGADVALSGDFVVQPGAPVRVEAFATPSGGAPLTTLTVSADSTLALYARGFDAFGNPTGAIAVAWTVDAPLVTLTPAQAALTVLDARRSGGTALHLATAGIPQRILPLTVLPGRLAALRIAALPQGPALADTTLAAGQSLALYAGGFDADGNALAAPPVVTWTASSGAVSLAPPAGATTLLTGQSPGTSRVTARAGTITTTTGSITVLPAALARIRISTAPDVFEALPASTVNADAVFELFALGEDAYGHALGLVPASWSSTNPLVAPITGSGSSALVAAGRTGTARLVAVHTSGARDTTATVIVVAGQAARVRIESRPDGTGQEIGDVALSCDSTLALHAVRRDADGNYVDVAPASWSLAGDIGTLSSALGSSVVLAANRLGKGRVTAIDFLYTDATGWITTTAGAPHHLRVEDAMGQPLAARLLRPGETLEARAAFRDADDNRIGETNAAWRWTGDALAPLPTGLVSRVTWTAGPTGRGRMIAETAGVEPDSTAWITVGTGTLARIEILDRLGMVIGGRSLACDSTLEMHAVAFDAGGNALGEVPVAWAIEGPAGLATLAPTWGSSTVLVPMHTGVVLARATHLLGAVARTGAIELRPGAPVRVALEDAPAGSGRPLAAATLLAGDTRLLYAIARDAKGNTVGAVEASFAVTGNIGRCEPTFGAATTFTAERTGAGWVALVHATLPGDRSGDLRVDPGAPAALAIQASPLDAGVPFASFALAAGDSVRAYAVTRDAFGNRVGPVAAAWSVAGDPGVLALSTLGPASAVTFGARRTGRADVFASWNGLTASIGPFDVRAGAVRTIALETAPDGSGTPLGPRALAAGEAVLLFAVARDAYGNLAGAVQAAWETVGGIGRLDTPLGASNRFVAEHPGTGFVRATSGSTASARTADWTVTPGPPVVLALERTPGEPSDPIGASSPTTDDSLRVFAVARDAFGNAVLDAPAAWTLAGDPASALLMPGAVPSEIRVFPRRPTTATLRATWNALAAESPAIVFLPGAPAGAIPIVATPDTLRPNATAALVAGPVCDRFGNPVRDGTRVDWTATAGTFAPGDDLDAATLGTQTATANGLVGATLTSPAVAGAITIGATSGAAHGQDMVHCLAPVHVQAVPGSFAPARIQRGAILESALALRNDDVRSLHIESGTLRFEDGNGIRCTAALAAPLWIAPGGQALVHFAPAQVPGPMAPGHYAPAVELAGRDGAGAAFLASFVLEPSSLEIAGGAQVHVTSRAPERVTSGQTVRFEIDVLNSGDVEARLDPMRCRLESPALGFATALDPATEWVLAPGAPQRLRFLPAAWPASSPGGAAPLQLLLHGVGAGPAYEESVIVAAVQIEAPGALAYVPGSLAPSAVPLGVPATLRARFHNGGGSALQLDPTTLLHLGSQSARLADAQIVAADSSAELAFEPLPLDGLAPGRYPLLLAARGTQNGAPFASELALSDSLVAFAPAALAILGVRSSQPSVTRDQTEPWDVDVVVLNSGQASYRIDLAELHIVLGGVDRTSTYALMRYKPASIPLAPAALDTVRFRVLRTGPDLGQATLEANLHATDLATGREVDVDTYSGGKGSVRVQAPSAVVAGPLLLSQPLVVAGQSRAIVASFTLRNDGEAAVRFEPAALAAGMTCVPAVPAQIESGASPLVLDGGEEVEVRWMLGPFAVPPGSVALTVALQGLETNRQRPFPVQANAALQVVAPAVVGVVGVQAPPRLTVGSTLPWTVRFVLQNTGGAAVRLQAPRLEIQAGSADVSGEFPVTVPLTFEGREDLELPGASFGVLRFEVAASGDLPRTLALGFQAPVVELASGRTLATASSAPTMVQVDTPPSIAIEDSTLAPRTVSRGQSVAIEVLALNEGQAALLLDRTRTTARLTGTETVAQLATTTVLATQAPRLLLFEPLLADVPSGTYTVDLHLEGVENDHPWAQDLRTAATIDVQPASSLEIVSVRAVPALVTSSQERPWRVRIGVRNHGAAARFENASLAISIGAQDMTSRFTMQAPTAFASGAAMLAPGAVDSLRFDVTGTPDVEGLAVLDVSLRARDANSNELLQTMTTGTTRGSVRIVPPALPVVLALVPSQTRVSAGQTGEWSVRCTFRNDGGTAWQPDWASAALAVGAAADDSVLAPAPSSASLAPGATGEATLRVVRTGGETGPLLLRLALAGTQTTDGARIAAPLREGTGPIALRPARAGVAAVHTPLPRAPHVNAGGRLPLGIVLENVGEASISVCRVRLHAVGATPADTLLETDLAGGERKELALVLLAGENAGALRVDAAIESAVDENDASHDDAFDPTRTASVALVSELPGVLRVEVAPGQPRVSAGQPTPWWLTLRVGNFGTEPLALAPPRATDLEFRRGGVAQLDYVVLAPDSMEEGGLLLGGGDQGTLRYCIARTGESGGDVEIVARARAAHTNDPAASESLAEARATVAVDDEPGVRLYSTDAWTVRRQHGHDDYRVHVGQSFLLRVVVENTGGTWLDSVNVHVDSQRGNSIVAPGFLASLAPGQRGALDLDAVAGTWLSEPGLPETFAAYVSHARDRNSGLVVLPSAPIDNATLAYVETPARLALGVAIESPLGAQDGELSPDQTFVVAAQVTNRGQAEVSASGRLTLDLPAGYTLVTGDSESFFLPGAIVRWTIRAPSASAEDPQSLQVRISAIPLDLDDGEPADVERDRAQVAVHVRAPQSLTAWLAIQGPAGSTDAVVSTGQRLDLEIGVRGDPDLDDREATLGLPPGWRDISGGTGKHALPPEPEARLAWPVVVGENVGSLPLIVRITARDRNDDSPHIATDTLQLRVERAARLAVAATIAAPAEAETGRLLPGQRFLLRARVRNQGEAAASGGTLRLVDLPPGYAVTSADRALLFDPHGMATAEWELRSPATARPGVETLRVAFAALPLDANTDGPATLDPDSAQARVAVSLVDDALAVDAIPLAAQLAAPGERRVPFLRLEIANQGGADVQLDSLGVQQVTGGAPATHALLSALHLVREDAPAETLSVAVVTAPIAWLGLPSVALGRLAAGATARWILLGDLAPQADSPGLALVLRATPNGAPLLRASQAGSHTPVPVRAAARADLASAPLRVIGSTLQAYNAPNPFHAGRETTTIRYQVESSADVEIRIATLRGEPVWETRRREETSGPALRALEWDGRNGAGQMVRNGVYVCHVQAGTRTTRFKIAVVR